MLAVVVRYKTPLEESETLQGLARAFEKDANLLNFINVLIWDNSPAPLDNAQCSFPVTYRHSPENLGVSGAYNRALKIAEDLCIDWLLLLDQDTTLPLTYLPRMLQLASELQSDSRIAAIAPFLVDGTRTISPGQLLFNRVKLLRPPFTGVHTGRMYAANSGTAIRTAAFREIGGFDEDFWLDLSDIVVFHRLHEKGKLLYVAGDLQLPHKVTLNDYDGSMSPHRYINFITAESAYWDLHRAFWERAMQTMRLLVRSVRQWLRYKNKSYARITFRHFLERIFHSRANRLNAWRKQSRMRNLPTVLHGRIIG